MYKDISLSGHIMYQDTFCPKSRQTRYTCTHTCKHTPTQLFIGGLSSHLCRSDQHLEGPDSECSTHAKEQESKDDTTLREENREEEGQM